MPRAGSAIGLWLALCALGCEEGAPTPPRAPRGTPPAQPMAESTPPQSKHPEPAAPAAWSLAGVGSHQWPSQWPRQHVVSLSASLGFDVALVEHLLETCQSTSDCPAGSGSPRRRQIDVDGDKQPEWLVDFELAPTSSAGAHFAAVVGTTGGKSRVLWRHTESLEAQMYSKGVTHTEASVRTAALRSPAQLDIVVTVSGFWLHMSESFASTRTKIWSFPTAETPVLIADIRTEAPSPEVRPDPDEPARAPVVVFKTHDAEAAELLVVDAAGENILRRYSFDPGTFLYVQTFPRPGQKAKLPAQRPR